jgi:hypothetical protein
MERTPPLEAEAFAIHKRLAASLLACPPISMPPSAAFSLAGIIYAANGSNKAQVSEHYFNRRFQPGGT